MNESWRHGFVETNGIRMHYVTQGEGPLLLLLHGFPEYWYSWRYQIPVLAEFFRVAAPDLRGYNETAKPKEIESYHLSELMADITGFIHALGEKRAVLVGHDWGGVLAWSLAMEYPEAVTRLIVLNAPHPAIFQRHLLKNPKQTARSWYMFLFQLPAVPEKLLSFRNHAFIRRQWASRLEKEAIERYIGAIAKPRALTSGINYYRANASKKFLLGALGRQKDLFPPVTAPTLLIWGEDDPYLCRELTEGVQAAYVQAPYELCLIPHCGHWVQQEKPEQVNRAMLEFLKQSV